MSHQSPEMRSTMSLEMILPKVGTDQSVDIL